MRWLRKDRSVTLISSEDSNGYFAHFFQPFFGTDESNIFKRIESGRYKWPKGLRVGASLKGIVAGLLNTKVEERLGVSDTVLDHPWVNNIDWDKMEASRYLVCLRAERKKLLCLTDGMRLIVQAPWIPPMPAHTRTWLNKALPKPDCIPGLKVSIPPVHREWDDRLPKSRPEY